ncbi:MAG: hypothetical protein H0V00_19550 [Chloroflexia bacterium]|nr:hypothetical protein [Chloroflexia bacterium]
MTDTSGHARRIAVTFSDHCFTRVARSHDPALVYPDSDRQPGHFCFDRYQLSLELPSHIATVTRGSVWTVAGDSYAAVPVEDNAGNTIVYRIVSSLDRVKGLPVALHMRVKTAYPADSTPFVTFGSVRFKHLVALRMQNKRPGRITDQNRKSPRVS